MLAKSIGSRFGVGFRVRLSLSRGCLSSEFVPVVMFLNGEGSGQHALKELLVECQGVPVQGHNIGGRDRWDRRHCSASLGNLKRIKSRQFFLGSRKRAFFAFTITGSRKGCSAMRAITIPWNFLISRTGVLADFIFEMRLFPLILTNQRKCGPNRSPLYRQ
jgi:hypothetical protein